MRWHAEEAARAALVAPGVARQFADETPDQEGRPDDDAAEERRLRVRKCAPDRTEAPPSGVSPVIALRVVEGIGQILVPVMGKVGGAIDRIGKPQRQRPAADRLVDAAVPGRVAVDGLVLQVQLPGDDPGADRGEAPPREIAIEERRQKPQSVDDESQRDRRPFNVATKRRKFDNLHELCSQPTRGNHLSRIG